MLGDEAHLARGLPRAVDHEIGDDRPIELGECVGEHEACGVIADKTDKDAARSERGDIARDRAGAADLGDIVPDRENGGRRLGRNARHLAVDEVIEHDVADAEHRLRCDELEGLFEIEHACQR